MEQKWLINILSHDVILTQFLLQIFHALLCFWFIFLYRTGAVPNIF